MDASQNILITGYYGRGMNFGNGPIPSAIGSEGAFVAKLDPSGAPIWSKGFASSGTARGMGIGVDSLGGVLVTGHFRNGIAIGGTPSPDSGIFLAKLAQ